MMHLRGVPFYLRQIESYASLSEAIENLCFTTNGYFAGEFSRIFASHFGTSAHFLRIIRSLSDAPQGVSRTTLAEMTRIPLGGTLSGMLDDLESAGFISHYVPFDKPEDARLRKYQLSDSYLNFYFSFIHKISSKCARKRELFSKTFMARPHTLHGWALPLKDFVFVTIAS
jgi:hypothetical protein